VWIGLAVVAASGAASALLLLLLLRHVHALGLVQVPNDRSSHSRPTPTGGGIGIVAGGTLAALVALAGAPWPLLVVLLAGLGFAALGLWDDMRSLPPVARLPVQVLLVAATLMLAVPLPALETALGWSVATPLLLALLVLGLAYWVNLFNFMDGIDGIAGSEAVFLLLAPLAVAGGAVAGGPLLWWPLGLAAAVLAFLAFNWQPAKIFMGDVGSTFLGYMTAVLVLLEVAGGWLGPWEALILAAAFATDGTVTLLRRALRGEAIMTAHRRHAYQHLARRFGSHQRVVLAFAAVNLCWLLPVALFAHALPGIAPLLAILAYAPVTALALLAGAGRPEHA
jgi:Fuc2NAc and GlcNAc transferase